jgi:hypothetical protein
MSWLSDIVHRDSKWYFTTSAGADIAVGAGVQLQVSGGKLYVKWGNEPHLYEITYGGVGVSLGVSLPVSGTVSFTGLPGGWGKIYRGLGVGAMDRNHFKGGFIMLSTASVFSLGTSGTLIFFGANNYLLTLLTTGPGALLGGFAVPALFNGIGFYGGMVAGSPSTGFSAVKGWMTEAKRL